MHDDSFPLRHLVHGGADSFFSYATGFHAAIGHQISAPERSPVDVDDTGVDLAHRANGLILVVGEDP